jgi:hypothetical protein
MTPWMVSRAVLASSLQALMPDACGAMRAPPVTSYNPTHLTHHLPPPLLPRSYAHTFKPLLDVILFTRSLSRVMGYK